MESYDDLKKQFERKVEELQERCPHEDVSDWMRLDWAPVHSTRFQVKICKNCKKEIARRTYCDGCGETCNVDDMREPPMEEYKEMTPEEAMDAPPMSTFWCEECYPKRREIWAEKMRERRSKVESKPSQGE